MQIVHTHSRGFRPIIMDYICNDCPRRCNALRREFSGNGFCRSGSLPNIVRAAPHHGEEPCISGTNGSGAIFFSGCNLHCVFCQNHEISRMPTGNMIDEGNFIDMLFRLQELNVHNINLVTPSHHIRFISQCLGKVKLNIPVVWNSSGYESVDMLKQLEGLVSIYMPDYKYGISSTAEKYSMAKDYPSVSKEAIQEMFRQVGPYKIDENGLMKSGVIIRHLILPGELENSKKVIDWVSSEYHHNDVLFSLMSQYTPIYENYSTEYKNLSRSINNREKNVLLNYMRDCGITNGYYQSLESSTKDMIPKFDGTGV